MDSLLICRREGKCTSIVFENSILRMLQQQQPQQPQQPQHQHQQSSYLSLPAHDNYYYKQDTSMRIVVPLVVQRNNNHHRLNTTNPLENYYNYYDPNYYYYQSTMSLCTNQRFLLCGSCTHGMLSIYDLSPWGISTTRNELLLPGHQTPRKTPTPTPTPTATATTPPRTTELYEPIQQSYLPIKSRTGLLSCRWYPMDSGAFLTATSTGNIHFWDTNEMKPIVEIRPYQYEKIRMRMNGSSNSTTSNSNNNTSDTSFPLSYGPCKVSCMEPCTSPTENTMMVGVCSNQSNTIKLLDLRTGSSSHTLQTNATSTTYGMNTICWSPINPYILASGTTGTKRHVHNNNNNNISSMIVLWDIRRPGSLAYLSTLNEEDCQQPSDCTISTRYCPYGTHWKKQNQQRQQQQQPSFAVSSSTIPTTPTKTLKKSKIEKRVSNSRNTSSGTPSNKSTSTTSAKHKIHMNKAKTQQRLTNDYYSMDGMLQSIGSSHVAAPNNYNTSQSDAIAVSHPTGKGIAMIQFHPSGHTLVSVSMDGDMRLWDLRTAGGGQYIQRRFVCSDGVSKPSGGGGGSSSGSNGTTTIMGLPLHITEHHHHPYSNSPSTSTTSSSTHKYGHSYTDRSMIWTAKGTKIYGYSMEDGGKPRHTLKGHLGTIRSFLPYGPGRFISCGEDGLVLVWNGRCCGRNRDGNGNGNGNGRYRQSQQEKQSTSNHFSNRKRTFQDVDAW